MAKKKKGSKQWGGKKMVKRVGMLGATGLAILPAAVPVATFATQMTRNVGFPAALTNATSTMGIDPYSGSINWNRAIGYATFTGACIAGAWLMRQAVKRA